MISTQRKRQPALTRNLLDLTRNPLTHRRNETWLLHLSNIGVGTQFAFPFWGVGENRVVRRVEELMLC